MPPRPLGLNAGVAHAECGVGCLPPVVILIWLLRGVLRPFRRHFMPTQRKRHCCRLLLLVLTMLLYVVETQRKDFDDYLKEDFHPVFFFVFSFHYRS